MALQERQLRSTWFIFLSSFCIPCPLWVASPRLFHRILMPNYLAFVTSMLAPVLVPLALVLRYVTTEPFVFVRVAVYSEREAGFMPLQRGLRELCK